jgi:hypothetical protein
LEKGGETHIYTCRGEKKIKLANGWWTSRERRSRRYGFEAEN